jgi:beta-N-acetylglucosaminidase
MSKQTIVLQRPTSMSMDSINELNIIRFIMHNNTNYFNLFSKSDTINITVY